MSLYLRLTGWQLHEALELKTSKPVSIIAGQNASGKSALVDGVEFAFVGTGKLRGITTKKDLADLSIHDDASSAAVAVGIPEIGLSIVRTMGRQADQEVEVSGTTYKVTKADAKIREKLGIEPERVRAALEADHILGGDEQKRRWIFFKATGTSATVGELLGPLTDAGLGEKDARRIADEVLVDGFPAGKKIAENERLKAGQKSSSATAAAPDPLWLAPWAEEGTKPLDFRAIVLADLTGRERDLEAKISEADVRAGIDRGTLEALYSAAKGRRSALLAERERAQSAPERYRTAEAALAEATLAVENLEGSIAEVRDKLGRYRGESTAIVSGRVEKPEVCPAIPGGPACPMSQTKLTAHRKTLDRRVDELFRLIGNEETALATLEERLGQAKTAEASSQTDVEDKRAREERLEAIVGELETAETKVTKTGEDLDEAAAPAEGSGDSAEALRERLENLRTLLEAKRRYDAASEAADAASGTRRDSDKERAAWDRAVKLLAPDGLPSRLFAARASELQGYLDELPFEHPLRLTASAEIEAKIGGRWRRRSQLSESWRIRASIGASHALARAAQFPILIVDRFDHLDGPGRVSALQSLRSVAKHYPGGVLVLSTLSRPDPKPTGVPDVETFVLEDGAIRSIG